MQTRIYQVIGAGQERLVEAGSAAQAIKHVVADHYSATVASPKVVANAMAAGISVEKAQARPTYGANGNGNAEASAQTSFEGMEATAEQAQ